MAVEIQHDATEASREDDFLFYLHRGSELMKEKRPEEARSALERAFQISPGNPKAQNLLGLVYFKLGLLEAAKSIYDRLVEEYPSEPPLYVNLGLVLLRQGRLNEAERALKKAIAISPEHARAHCYLGLVLYRRGDLALAREHFLKGQADEFARKVEARLAKGTLLRPSQAEMLRQVAENGFRDLENTATPFKALDLSKDERVVRDEEAWEAWVPHDRQSEGSSSLGIDVSSLLPVWNLTPLPTSFADPLKDTAPGGPSPWQEPTPQIGTLARVTAQVRADRLEAPPLTIEDVRLARAREATPAIAIELLGRDPDADRFPAFPPKNGRSEESSPSPLAWSQSIEAVNSAREKLAFPALVSPPMPSASSSSSILPPPSVTPHLSALSMTPVLSITPQRAPSSQSVDLALSESSDLPSAVMFGENGTSTADILSEVQSASSFQQSTATGYHAGPGSRARLMMDARAYLKGSTIVAASGRLAMAPAMSQLQGRTTATPFGDPSDPMCLLEGRAVVLIRVPRMAVALRGVRDLHVVSSGLMGFDDGFTWDNGKILGLDVVTLRGSGSLLLDTRGTPMLIPVDQETPVHAAVDAVLAWSDGVRPSPVEGGNGDARLFRLRGRGYVLVAFPPESKR